jgi:flagellar hook-basal body complex protein FliE
MSIGMLDAASAYRRSLDAVSPLMPQPAAEQAGGAPVPGDSGTFGDIVEKMVSDTAGSLRHAETASAKQVAGKGDLVDVVTAIGAAETALDTVVAVRDKVVNAYNDIMHMQI